MSTKHLRRYLEEKRQLERRGHQLEEKRKALNQQMKKRGRGHLYEFLEESEEGGDESSGAVEESPVEKKLEKKEKKMVDSRMLNVENELRSILGRRSIDIVQRGQVVFGKIVKKKPTWPEVKNVGLSMELDRTEGNIFWFRFSHHAYYRELQQSFWIASESLSHGFISNILAQCPYHLDSLLIMAELLRQQEDYQLSRDLIERGLFCCESLFAPRFQLSNFDHRIDYTDFENRAFYLLLHRHLRNLVDRHCFKTALHVAKLIYRLDPVSDPLAIMLTIDMIALKARDYNYLILLYNTLQIASAIRHFPTVLLKLLDAMNVQPDSAVENNEYINALAYERESEGMKLLISMYVKLASSIWLEDPSILSWLEVVTTSTVSSFNYFKDELAEWEKLQRKAVKQAEGGKFFNIIGKFETYCRRKTCYVGIPRNIERHAYLWEVTRNAEWILSDPAPPYNGRMMYTRIANTPRPDSFFSGLLHSIWPNYDQTQHLNASIEEVLNVLRGIFVTERPVTDGANNNQEEHNREALNEVDDEEVEAREMEQEHTE
ncbi:hypothetical protein DINM_001220 [Dirofilaria immitis]|nr:hypothetical protein [Dirofilaria immitis]